MSDKDFAALMADPAMCPCERCMDAARAAKRDAFDRACSAAHDLGYAEEQLRPAAPITGGVLPLLCVPLPCRAPAPTPDPEPHAAPRCGAFRGGILGRLLCDRPAGHDGNHSMWTGHAHANWSDGSPAARTSAPAAPGEAPSRTLTVKRLPDDVFDYDAEVWEGDVLVASVRVYNDAEQVARLLSSVPPTPYPQVAAPGTAQDFAALLDALCEAVAYRAATGDSGRIWAYDAARAAVEEAHRVEVGAVRSLVDKLESEACALSVAKDRAEREAAEARREVEQMREHARIAAEAHRKEGDRAVAAESALAEARRERDEAREGRDENEPPGACNNAGA